MVGIGFALMVLIDDTCGKIGDAYNRLTGQEERELSPAAMVGSFSRYK